MPGSFPPFVLYDNAYDRINQYPAAVLSSTAVAVGRDPKYIADYRRERTYMQFATAVAGHAVDVDLGAGNTKTVDTLFIDRGHNLWGQTLSVRGSDDLFATSPTIIATAAVPALDASGNFVPGGDPTVGWCVTEEGAIYTFIAGAVARRSWRILTATTPTVAVILTGVILGVRTQLTSYSKTLDEDAGGRKRNTDESEAGYTAGSRVYPYRNLLLELGVIGATEYDGQIRLLRRALFEKQIPAFVCMNYGRWPERAWLYILDTDRWSFSTNGVHRAGSIPLRELYPIIR